MWWLAQPRHALEIGMGGLELLYPAAAAAAAADTVLFCGTGNTAGVNSLLFEDWL